MKTVIMMSFFLSLMMVVVDHPLILGALLILMVGVVGFLVCYYFSVFYGFVVFMVVVGGMLVVFAYAVALVPYVSFSFKGLMHPFLLLFLVYMGWLNSISSHDLSGLGGSASDFQYMSTPMFSVEWGLVTFWLSLLLFIMMIAVAGICMKASGRGSVVVGKSAS